MSLKLDNVRAVVRRTLKYGQTEEVLAEARAATAELEALDASMTRNPDDEPAEPAAPVLANPDAATNEEDEDDEDEDV